MSIAQFVIYDEGADPRFQEGPFSIDDVAHVCGMSAETIRDIIRSARLYKIDTSGPLNGQQCVQIINEVKDRAQN